MQCTGHSVCVPYAASTVSTNGCLPACDAANEMWPSGCQSCVRITCSNRAARVLIAGMIASPSATASGPPGMKSFCMSITSSASVERKVGRDFMVLVTSEEVYENDQEYEGNHDAKHHALQRTGE